MSKTEAAKKLKIFYSDAETVLGSSDLETLCKQLTRIEAYPYTEDQPRVLIGNTESLFNSELEDMEQYAEEGDILIKEPFSQSDTVKELLRAMLNDCKEGNMAQVWEYHKGDVYGTVNLAVYISKYQTEYRDITIYADCENTIECLRQLVKKPEYQ